MLGRTAQSKGWPVASQFNKLDSQGANLLTRLRQAASCLFIVYASRSGGASPSHRDKDGWAPVHVAACWGRSWTPLKLWPQQGAPTWTSHQPLGTVYTCARTRRSGNAWIQSRRRRAAAAEPGALKPLMSSSSFYWRWEVIFNSGDTPEQIYSSPDSSGPTAFHQDRFGFAARRWRDKNLMSRKEAVRRRRVLHFLTPEEDAAG
uniref:ANK_REP_REGION domain-containing protein n=1 Tax=Macrostomum lignano TaxID=282301 RepID=A0A1I8F9P7_9PLAT